MPGFSKKRLGLKSRPLDMNKNGFSEIFHCKEVAGSRAQKARGCFSSNMVGKIVLSLNCSFVLRTLTLRQSESN